MSIASDASRCRATTICQRTCWQVRKSATDTNTPAMTWAARVCRKIGVPSLGRSAVKSLMLVVVDILSSGFTYVARVPVTPTPFIRQPGGGTQRAQNTQRIIFRDEGQRRGEVTCFRVAHPSRRSTKSHRDRVISRARGRLWWQVEEEEEEEVQSGKGKEVEEEDKGKERKKARATRARRTLARKSIHVRA